VDEPSDLWKPAIRADPCVVHSPKQTNQKDQMDQIAPRAAISHMSEIADSSMLMLSRLERWSLTGCSPSISY